MIVFKTKKEIEYLRESSLLVGKTLAEVAKVLKPGVKTSQLDDVAEAFIRNHDAAPGFKGYKGFPSTLCISVNEQVVHGIPGDTVIEDGDIVSVDCGVLKNGYYGDSAYTFAVGNVDPEVMALLDTTKESLYKGIKMAREGNRLGDIGFAVQHHVEAKGYSVVRDLVGHGIGRGLHEDPQVPNYGMRNVGVKLKEGMTICIEPMINMGTKEVVQKSDGWTITTADYRPSAHFEHEIAITKGEADILSSFEFVEEILNLQKK